MVERFRILPDVCPQSIIAGSRGSWEQLSFVVASQCGSAGDGACDFQALEHGLGIARIGEVVGANLGRVQRIAGSQRYPATTERTNQRRTESKGMLLELLEAMLNEVSRRKVVLHVRRLQVGRSLDETT